jgi:hypothetical protein
MQGTQKILHTERLIKAPCPLEGLFRINDNFSYGGLNPFPSEGARDMNGIHNKGR